MSPPFQKRSYQTVRIAPADQKDLAVVQEDIFGKTSPENPMQLWLDQKPLCDSRKRVLIIPGPAVAEKMAQEWRAQETRIHFETMPITSLFFAAYNGLCLDIAYVQEEIMKYSAHDLLFVRASYPAELYVQQKRLWTPILLWAEEKWNITFLTTRTLSAPVQAEETLETLHTIVVAQAPFPLARVALYRMITGTGSVLLSLATLFKVCSPKEAWKLSHLESAHQHQLWGRDREDDTRLKQEEGDFYAATEVLMCRDPASGCTP